MEGNVYRSTSIIRWRLMAAVLGLVVAVGWSTATTSHVWAAAPNPNGSIVIGPPDSAMEYFPCAPEGAACLGANGHYAAFGANGSFIFTVLQSDTATCDVGTFGGDPAPGVVKACYFANYRRVAAENATRPFPAGGAEIAYGANGVFTFRVISGLFACNNATFGDPIPGQVKACYIANPDYQVGVGEGGNMTNLPPNTPVAYGARGRYVYRMASGSIACTNATFGSDPAPGTSKVCYRLAFGFLADEGQPFSFNFDSTGFARVIYGSARNGAFMRRDFTTFSGVCGNDVFGGDPDFGTVKHCYFVVAPG